MIDPNTYSNSIYQPAAPVAAHAAETAQDAADAAEFARILAQPASTPATPIALEQKAPEVSTVVEAQKVEDVAESGPSFFGFIKGVIDTINPLQHIPVVSAIYRHLTGDEIHPMAQLAGDAIYGGPLGAAVAVADITYQKTTGKDVGQTVIAALIGDDKKAEPATSLAQNFNNTLTPAAGQTVANAVIANDIIWDDAAPVEVAQNSSLPTTPTPLLQAREEGELALHPTPTPTPVLHEKDNVNPTLQQLTASKVDSTTVLHRQTALGDTSRMGVSPELISVKMMEGLDKYKAMNTLAIMANGVAVEPVVY